MQLKNFFTPIEALDFKNKISHTDQIISVGSCFATEIGNRLRNLEFDILVNPFGTIFNPISIFNLLTTCLNQTPLCTKQIVSSNGLYYHYQWHSSIFGTSKEDLIHKIEVLQKDIRTKLKSSNHLVLTFGTSIIHEYNSIVVSNCHKQHKDLFNKRFLDLEELKSAFETFNALLLSINPHINIITTTSPVRHTKEGLIDNNQSKAILNVFNKYLNESHNHLQYFPSYEIVMDVLRDYRFFKSDLIHPTEQAVDEIWRYFHSNLVSPNSYTYITKMEKYLQMDKHILLFPDSENGKQFIKKKQTLYNEIQDLK